MTTRVIRTSTDQVELSIGPLVVHSRLGTSGDVKVDSISATINIKCSSPQVFTDTPFGLIEYRNYDVQDHYYGKLRWFGTVTRERDESWTAFGGTLAWHVSWTEQKQYRRSGEVRTEPKKTSSIDTRTTILVRQGTAVVERGIGEYECIRALADQSSRLTRVR